jgi:hypothetical protein
MTLLNHFEEDKSFGHSPVPVIDLDPREHKLLNMCIEYSRDPFGAPNHTLMILVAKLYAALVKQLLYRQEK